MGTSLPRFLVPWARTNLYAIGDYGATLPPTRVGGYLRTTSDSASSITTLAAQTNPVMGVWTSLGFTFDGTTLQGYKNGYSSGSALPIGSSTVAALSTTSTPVLCADFFNHGLVNYANAQIGSLAMWKTVPTAAEYKAVSDHYNTLFGMNQFSGQYLFAGFENGGGEGGGIENLIMARASNPAGPYSYEPSNLTLPSGHVLRDPSIMPYRNGYAMVASNVSLRNGFSASTSFDLYWTPGPVNGFWNWSYVGAISCASVVSGSNAGCWAPDLTVDPSGGLHVIVAASNTATSSGNGFLLYETHPAGSDFADVSTWSPLAALGGNDAGGYGIDATLRFINGLPNILYANNSNEYVELAEAATLTGNYTTTKSGNWLGFGAVEAPIWVDALPGQGQCIAVDARGTGYYLTCNKGPSLASGWSTPVLMQMYSFAGGPLVNPFQHGSIIKLF